MNSDYFPEDFRDQIEEYKKERRSKSEFVRSGYLHPDYKVLKGKRLNYYLWWRSEIRKLKPQPVDDGYIWLYGMELLNSSDDPEEVLQRIINFIDVYNRNFVVSVILGNMAEDYAITRKLSRNLVPRRSPFPMSRQTFAWDLTRYPMHRPDDRMLLGDRRYDLYVSTLSYDDMAEIIFRSLQGIDELVRSTEGKSLVRYLGCEYDTKDYIPFSNFKDYSNPEHIVDVSLDNEEKHLSSLIQAILKQANNFTRNDGKSSNIPKTFPEAYRRIVAAAVDSVVLEEPWNPRSFRAGPDEEGFWEDDDLIPAVVEQEAYVISMRGYYERPRLIARELNRYWGMESDEPEKYISSGTTSACYEEMTDQQKRFYIYWRTQARKGNYSLTDDGYIWLYCTELVNHDDDPIAVQNELEAACRAYGTRGNTHLLRRTAVEHALLHDMDTPPYNSGDQYLTLKFKTDPIGRIPTNLPLCFPDCWKMRKYVDNEMFYSAVYTVAMRALDSCYRRIYGKRLYDIVTSKPRTDSRIIYRDLWTPDYVYADIKAKYLINSSRFVSTVGDGFIVALRTANKLLGKSAPRLTHKYPDEYVEAIEAAVTSYVNRRNSKQQELELAEMVETMVIDRDAVNAAKSDLDAVTELMAIEGEEHDDPDEVQPKATGWDAFRNSLDDDEKEYLKALLEGRKPSMTRRPAAVESSLNEKAMDAVGDAVMEAGELFEEYMEEIKGVLE